MALEDAQSRRAHGVRPLAASELAGSRGVNGDAMDLPVATYRNPGPTENLRGIEANTGKAEGSNIGAPEVRATDGVPVSAPFQVPDSAGRLTTNDSRSPHVAWKDSSANNSQALVLPHDAFSALGESYPANGGLDGES